MYVSAMTNGCLLSKFQTNSRIDHAVAKQITGPYMFKDVAVNTEATNAAPVALKDGTFAIFHIYTGTGPPDGGQNCNQSQEDIAYTDEDRLREMLESIDNEAGGSTIHVAKSLDGPWMPLVPNTLPACGNPAPWVHPNGTIYVACRGAPLIYRAENISGPWTRVKTVPFSGGPGGKYEDPFLYSTSRGWHLLYHVYNLSEPHGGECIDSTVSAHAYSVDGFTWHASPAQPYGTQVKLTTGETVTVATRERPKIWFNSEGQMTHLLNGVCAAAMCPNSPSTGCVDCKFWKWDYTLVQALDLDEDEASLTI
jgi:hypothetical protein